MLFIINPEQRKDLRSPRLGSCEVRTGSSLTLTELLLCISTATKCNTSLNIIQHYTNAVYGLCLDASPKLIYMIHTHYILNKAGIKYLDIM